MTPEVRADLLRVAGRILRDPVAAEDVVQDALLKLHVTDGPVVRPDAWLRRVARNLALDRLRGLPHEPIEDIAVEPAEPHEGTDTVASWLPAMVEALDEPYRTAVREVDLEGLSQAAYAARHGLSLSGARTRVQRGRKQLHERLLACCPVRFEEGAVVDTGLGSCGCQ
ncbi:MAG: sigma-70 family RNA polymerase sigma factor [Alphaproteobacteria bacterium]|nr:sigma-70 family RNA polymerase sigma factor [Alphaproteobacteria bacterium]